ncbi:serine/threonine protein kinase [Mycobacterium florentinum]|uniref:non-specific serine/threonine protein kinase n=1 Tax=Mycobacterium florentinum TaxID=292462 RepID=A0A1X1UEG6_MYCFL|nr:serine/threonine-protein kinase PknH/PknJ [Mycobacterium florentinum]MCV7411779.1 sensor domain-containing protein [Mycobacterium florentinum]ORV55207.1 serine/threonine protein kinase [Mycobacterium florentinum]BBX81144.1 serine/threonine-protein kinase PknH [Mycobacterium florentinum]
MSEGQASREGSTFGPYHLKRLLGRGGMGEVYEAEHTVKEWTVAVKLMSDQFSSDPVFRERMKREARTAGRLQEPHVVPIHDYGEIDGKMFMEMRLVEGTDLDSLLKRYGPLTPPRAVAIITQIASALDAAHAAGVMHRDVKPPNILVTRDDFAYLVDFGIASATTDEKLTQLGTAVGTWKYMAPERFTNDEVTYRADIYALACVLHECLTGSPPYRADSAGVLVKAHMSDPIPLPSAVRAGIPKAFDAVIGRGMAKKPEERYASAGDLALAAHEALSNPDQDHASDILRRSQEATLPGKDKLEQPPTIAGTMAAPPVQQRPTTPPPRTPTPYPRPSSTPVPPHHAPSPRPWAPESGPVPSPAQPVSVPQYYQGGSGNRVGPPTGNLPPAQPVGHTPWGLAQPPKPKRNPWPIIAAAAVVVVVLVSAVAIWLIIPDPKPPPDPIASDKLNSLLLSPSEINAIMGATNIQPGKPITTMGTSTMTVSIPDCKGALYTTQDQVYAGSGYTGINGLVASEPGDDNDHWVNQAVVSFPTADKAKAFLQSSADKWKKCVGQTVTVTNSNDKTYRWTFAPIQGTSPKISVLQTQEGADGWQCEHAMSVANNVIVDVNACGYHISDQSSQIADKIVDKVNNI